MSRDFNLFIYYIVSTLFFLFTILNSKVEFFHDKCGFYYILINHRKSYLIFKVYLIKCIPDKSYLDSLPSDSTSQLNIFRKDGDSLGMDSAEVGVLKEANKIGLSSFLKSENC